MGTFEKQYGIFQIKSSSFFTVPLFIILSTLSSYAIAINSTECIKTGGIAINIKLLNHTGSIVKNSVFTKDPTLLINEWELLRREGDYIVLRSTVKKQMSYIRKKGLPVPFYVYYYMAHSYQTELFDTGLSYCDSALATHTNKKYLYEKGQTLKGVLLRKMGNYRKSIYYLLPLIKTVSNDSIRCEINRQLSINYRKIDLYDSAIYYSQIAERIADKLDNRKYQYYAIQSMANIYSSLGEYEQALKKERELMKIAFALGKNNLIISNIVNLTVSYFDLNQEDSALFYYNKGVILANKINDFENLSLLNIAYAGYLINVGDYSRAQEVMLKALDICEQSGRSDIILRSYYYLCQANIGSGQYDEAIRYAKSGIILAKKLETSVELASFYSSLSDIFYKQGDYQNAFNFSEEHRLVMDSVFNVSKMQTIKDLTIRYETEKKQGEIDALTQLAAINDLKLKQKNLLIAISAIVTFVLIFALILIYRQRLSNEQNRTLEMKQRLLRSQLNPHFIFNALGAIQQFIYQKKNPVETGDYLGRFSQLTRMILNHSDKNLITLEEEIEFLTNYLTLQTLRFDEPFEYQLKIDDNLVIDEVLIPPMFTQPFIENSIEHGILYKQEKGVIEVWFKKHSDMLEIVLQDNGVGREKASFEKRNQKHRSMATKITMERIKNLEKIFRKKASLVIEDIINEKGNVTGTQVVFILPLIYQN